MDRAELTRLLRATGCAEERDGFTFLCDPAWSAHDRAQVTTLQGIENRKSKTENSTGWLCVPTGGSGGGVRFARHDEQTLSAAVTGFCAHFALERVNAVGVLPAHHVSGLMARVRCAATAGAYLAADWKSLESGRRPVLAKADWVISLVPTQLQRLLQSPDAVTWLRGFRVIFVGGGPVWPELAAAAARAELPVSLSYGMTETAAMVTAQRPAEFLAGDRSSGTALRHARLALDGEGVITVTGESVFRGYFPGDSASRRLVTEDLGRIDAQGRLHVLGRRDAVIITGGEKVQPAEVEAALRASGEFADVAVVGLPDPQWGQTVLACYPAGGKEPDLARAAAALAGLTPFKRPKRYLPLAPWPRNAQGKLNRPAVVAAAAAKLKVES